eukprot:TRINITY_DN29357_c0_g1_i1.p1 TRINITY_DN29357_c0_g1~~TRINITY_DN29357_c0_g1_i1.p1  ORF type:complete len:549 (-),score=86.21 TRINITY_DN29357_c0_g1_i1:1360-3006(-)
MGLRDDEGLALELEDRNGKDGGNWGMEEEIGELDSSEKRLNELGYKQEMKREMNLLDILSIGFALGNPFISLIPLFYIPLSYGGPVAVVWPWWPVFFFVIMIGLSLSEICSAYPTMGSLYFWGASLCPPKWRSLVSWMTAWLEVLALVVANCTASYASTQLIQQVILLMTGGANGGGYLAPTGVFYAIFAAQILSWALFNSFGTKFVAHIFNFIFFYNIVLIIVICIVLPVVAPTLQDAHYVYFTWETSSAVTGVNGDGYNWMFSMLLPMFCGFGYDVAAHVTEETRRADISGPKAIMISIFMAIVVGFALLNVFTFCIQGYWGDLFDPANATGGAYPVAQIVYDCFYNRYGNASGAHALLILMVVPLYAAGLSVALGASRAMFAFARDGAMPFSSFLKHVTSDSKVPLNAQWTIAILAILLGLPVFGSTVVFNAVVSITVVAWVGTYGVPIFFRLFTREEDFPHGPFYLGRWSKPIGFLALMYIIYTCIFFMVPFLYPITLDNFNYAPIATGLFSSIAFIWWLIDARRWFKGPVRTSPMESFIGQSQ